ncbi:UDP-N-acetylglucosamine--N-acetylmuramyl-(pentapeptide) pyrophosphoryl-undecaprenol N-acetylglucosamine transferase [Pseudothermotoga sp.]|uniref:UDP-N-acetylglucosamine--N-acetylmuramyl- (pentapeptide) pyrophosphoryl-undecaprenol N-acetylglucosamine transferase n=1 Tax=Pseudothermotoga sp. TaxID=2033661 RepID=UPI000E8BA02B|nr:UDP-N-acetylglucosamine--N-acetylmuramyl-(pentapeptide) pyrophosphoryl-undecaprenol N-acetylglucosamine transferase [Pseudothermotoga sp.]HBJ81640.1 UDP-N-acetylglucosamine--N-acetylmuramyl-(pentapeptide) pyrophosphoryl-undecaprenol N-acetylglucosamine transferase [Pseudothermotoga sp.]
MRISAAGGGTGGHLYPAVSILEKLAEMKKLNVTYFCLEKGIESKILPLEHPEYKLIKIDLKGLERPIWKPSNFTRLLKISQSESIIALEIKQCDFGLMTGGYISYPVGKVCKKLKKPFFIQEQNVVPGLANKALSLSAKKIFVAFDKTVEFFPKSVRNKILVTGNPVREKDNEEMLFGKDYVLVLGGSRGSEFINNLMEEVYKVEHNLKFVHSTGSKEWVDRLSIFENVKAVDYIYNASAAWKGARAVIARAGATTIGEMLYYGLPGVLMPWDGATGSHQLYNALEIEKMGKALVLKECDATVSTLLKKLYQVLEMDKKPKMKINPAEIIAKTILEELK